WARVPAERVLSVEAATGVSRATLRPDLYDGTAAVSGDLDETDAARAQEYALLAALLARAPDAGLLEQLASLCGDATPIGLAHAAGACRGRPRTVRAASQAMDRTLLRRSRARRGRRLLSRSRDARPGVYRDRDRGFGAAGLSKSSGPRGPQEVTAMKRERKAL